MTSTEEFNRKQPGYIYAMLSPSSLKGYGAKHNNIPKFLDYWLFGPPAVRDSSPGGMALIFGRTDHDTNWNKKPKGTLVRAFNSLFLIAMYICFLYVPFHRIYYDGVRPYRDGVDTSSDASATVTCAHGFLRDCQPGCERAGLFKCVLPK